MPYFNVNPQTLILELADMIEEQADEGSIFTASEAAGELRNLTLLGQAELSEWLNKFTPDEMEKEVLTSK